MTLIILEGPDGTGKTTLGKKLAETYNTPYHPSRGKRKTLNEFIKGVQQDAALKSGILDRLTVISDWVYKRAARKYTYHHPEEIKRYLQDHPSILIFCTVDEPQIDTSPKKHKPEKDMCEVAANARRIQSNYILIHDYLQTQNIPIIKYNWQTDNWDTLLRRIEYQNANLEFPQSLRRNTSSQDPG